MPRKFALVGAFALVTIASAVRADTVEDYVACLIGRAAIELNRQGTGQRNSEKAMDVAYAYCHEPAALAEEEGDPDDFVRIMVEAMAKRLGG